MCMEEYRDTGNENKKRHIHMILSMPPRLSISEVMVITKRQDSDKTLQKLSCSQEEALLGEPFLEPEILCKCDRLRWE